MKNRLIAWLIGFATALVCLSWMPLPNALLGRFETMYVAPKGPLTGYAGVVVLGGNQRSSYASIGQQQVELFKVTDRMVQAVVLARQYPMLKLVYTNGISKVKRASGPGTTTQAPSRSTRFFSEAGVAEDRLILERAATTTRENATLTAALPGLDITRPWLLLTSAAHMPRAMAAFNAVGWNVTAYPVDFQTNDRTRWLDFSLAEGAALWQNVASEALGWMEYRLRGWV